MSYQRSIRGRKPTKTGLVLRYLVNHNDQVLTPKEVADDLGFEIHITVTILNRLASKGTISKKGRGLFCYNKENGGGVQKKIGAGGPKYGEDKVVDFKMDVKTAARIYNSIYRTASDSMSAGVMGSLTGLGLDDFDENAPAESIRNLVGILIDLFGEQMTDDILSIALDNGFSGEKSLELRRFLKVRKKASSGVFGCQIE